MFQIHRDRDLPAKAKASTPVATKHADSQTRMNWNSEEGRFYKDANGIYCKVLLAESE